MLAQGHLKERNKAKLEQSVQETYYRLDKRAKKSYSIA